MTHPDLAVDHWQLRPKWDKRDRDFANFRRNGMSAGLDGTSNVKANVLTNEHYNGNLRAFGEGWEFMRKQIPPWFVNKVLRVGTGNPFVIRIDGVDLTNSDLLALWDAWRLHTFIEHEPRVIVEIGGGFGCLAAMLLRMWPQSRYIGVDLPQSLELQRYYLAEEGFADRVTLLETCPASHFDLVINIRSMMEMTLEQVTEYFDWMQGQEHGGYRFYCCNRKNKRTRLADYPFDNGWRQEIFGPHLTNDEVIEMLLYRL